MDLFFHPNEKLSKISVVSHFLRTASTMSCMFVNLPGCGSDPVSLLRLGVLVLPGVAAVVGRERPVPRGHLPGAGRLPLLPLAHRLEGGASAPLPR